MVISKLFGDFFKGKNVLITGHTGFIGSWLAIWMNELGANIIGYALPPYTKYDNFIVSNLQEKIINIVGDIRDFDKLNKIFKKYNPDIIFHLAAQSIVRKSYEIPKETYEINVGGTINVLEAFRKNEKCKILINFTSDKCYENREWIWGYREKDRLGGRDPYSSSKACSEIITSAYNRSFFQSSSSQNRKIVSSVRSGNVIGGGDWQKDRLVPDCMRAIKNNKTLNIRNPQSIRPWLHVLETIRGCLILTMKMWDGNDEFSGSWNFGSDKNSIFSVYNIVKKIVKFLGKDKYEILLSQESDKLYEANLLLLDCSKSNRYLGWTPALDIDEVIKLTCQWYMEDNINYDFDVKQIKNYLKIIN